MDTHGAPSGTQRQREVNRAPHVPAGKRQRLSNFLRRSLHDARTVGPFKDMNSFKDSCIPLSIAFLLNVDVQLRGSMTYADAIRETDISLTRVPITDVGRKPCSFYIIHECNTDDCNPVGHATPVRVGPSLLCETILDGNVVESTAESIRQFLGAIPGAVAMEVCRGGAGARYTADTLLANQASGESGSSSSHDDGDSSCESLSEQHTLATDKFKKALKKEVSDYNKEVHLTVGLSRWPCEQCPFRTFGKKRQLISHRRHHTDARLGTSSDCRAQSQLAAALYDMDKAREVYGQCYPISGEGSTAYLKESAKMIRMWVGQDATPEAKEVLQRSNDLRLVWVYTDKGPILKLKSQTTGCWRKFDTYYTPEFASLLLATALRSKCRTRTTADALVNHFASTGCMTAMRMPRDVNTFQSIIKDVVTGPRCEELAHQLLEESNAHNEWKVVAHDATYKVLLNVIGQKKMAQSLGGCFAAHTLRGLTGACAGVSLQSGESTAHFARVVEDLLPKLQRREKTEFLFTDSPPLVME